LNLNYTTVKQQAEDLLLDNAVKLSESNSLAKNRELFSQTVFVDYLLSALQDSSSTLTDEELSQIYERLSDIGDFTNPSDVPTLNIN
jgi:hypothetical protein